MRNWTVLMAVVATAVLSTGLSRADVLFMAEGLTSLEFVTVGDPGNVGQQSRLAYDDPTYYGAVPYTYQIGKYDVTMAQYCEFLNAVAKDDTYGLYNPIMGTYYPTVAITRTGSPGDYHYAVTGAHSGTYDAAGNCPSFGVTWAAAARFCNWLENGQPTGDQGPGTTETGAYTLNGAMANADLMAIARNPGAVYAIPSEDEWYKAAFYQGGGLAAGYWTYPTRSNDQPSNELSATGTNNANYYDGGYTDPTNGLTPVGTFKASPSPYGAYDMGGNLWQWNEAKTGSQSRGLRGGDHHLDATHLTSSYRDYNSSPASGWSTVTLRLVRVPEPSVIALLFAGVLALVCRPRRERGTGSPARKRPPF